MAPEPMEIDGCRIAPSALMKCRVEDRYRLVKRQDPDALTKARLRRHEESLARRQPMCVAVQDETVTRRHTTVLAHADVKLAMFRRPEAVVARGAQPRERAACTRGTDQRMGDAGQSDDTAPWPHDVSASGSAAETVGADPCSQELGGGGDAAQ